MRGLGDILEGNRRATVEAYVKAKETDPAFSKRVREANPLFEPDFQKADEQAGK